VPARATSLSPTEIRIDFWVTLDGVLLAGLAPTYQVLRRSDGALLASGTLTPDAGPALYSVIATVTEPRSNVRVKVAFTYAGIVVEEDADVLELKDTLAEVLVGEPETTVEIAEPSLIVETVEVPIAVDVLEPSPLPVALEDGVEVALPC
jgi:hypothetical protein